MCSHPLGQNLSISTLFPLHPILSLLSDFRLQIRTGLPLRNITPDYFGSSEDDLRYQMSNQQRVLKNYQWHLIKKIRQESHRRLTIA